MFSLTGPKTRPELTGEREVRTSHVSIQKSVCNEKNIACFCYALRSAALRGLQKRKLVSGWDTSSRRVTDSLPRLWGYRNLHPN